MLLVPLVFAACALWVMVDASRHQITRDDHGSWYRGGPASWGFASFFLWPVVFPSYLIGRRRLIESARDRRDATPPFRVEEREAPGFRSSGR